MHLLSFSQPSFIKRRVIFAFYEKAEPKDQYSLAFLPSKTFPTGLLPTYEQKFQFLHLCFSNTGELYGGIPHSLVRPCASPLVQSVSVELCTWAFVTVLAPACPPLKMGPAMSLLLRVHRKPLKMMPQVL